MSIDAVYNNVRRVDGVADGTFDTLDLTDGGMIYIGGKKGQNNQIITSNGTKVLWNDAGSHILTYTLSCDGLTISGAPSNDFNNSRNITIEVLKVPNVIKFDVGLIGADDYDGSSIETLSVDFGTTSATACVGDDARLSDDRPNPNAISVSNTLSGSAYDGSSAISDWSVVKVPNNLTAGTNISYSVGTTFDGSTAITISSTDTTYTASDGILLDSGTNIEIDHSYANTWSAKQTATGLDIDIASGNSELGYYINGTNRFKTYVNSATNDILRWYSYGLQSETMRLVNDAGVGYPQTSLCLDTMANPFGGDSGLRLFHEGTAKWTIYNDSGDSHSFKIRHDAESDDRLTLESTKMILHNDGVGMGLEIDAFTGNDPYVKFLINGTAKWTTKAGSNFIIRDEINSDDAYLFSPDGFLDISVRSGTSQGIYFSEAGSGYTHTWSVYNSYTDDDLHFFSEAQGDILTLDFGNTQAIIPSGIKLKLAGETTNTFVYCDSNNQLTSLTNATGLLHNNGSGTFSYATQIFKADGNDAYSLNSGYVSVGVINGTGYPPIGKLVICNTGVSTCNLEFRTDDSTLSTTDYPTANIECGFTSTSWDDAYFTIQTHGLNTSAFTDDLTIKGGNVGINTATPSARLHVVDRNARFYLESDRQAGRIYQFASSGTNGEGFDFRDKFHNKRVWLYYNNSYQLWDMNGAEQMRLTTTGLGIKKTPSGYELDVNGDGRAVSFVETSDKRVKTNITDYSTSKCLDVIQSIPIKKYDYIDGFNNGNKDVIGFLADDLVNNPELKGVVKKHDEYVSGKDDDSDNVLVYKDFLGVAKPRLIAFLIGSIQELKKEITELRTELNILKSQ